MALTQNQWPAYKVPQMMKRAPDNVRYRGQFGERILTRSFAARDLNQTLRKLRQLLLDVPQRIG
jgi:hypothetical protein